MTSQNALHGSRYIPHPGTGLLRDNIWVSNNARMGFCSNFARRSVGQIALLLDEGKTGRGRNRIPDHRVRVCDAEGSILDVFRGRRQANESEDRPLYAVGMGT